MFADHITGTLDLVNAGNWHPRTGADWPLWGMAHLVVGMLELLEHALLTGVLDQDGVLGFLDGEGRGGEGEG